MVTSAAPDMGLGFKPAAADFMRRPPRSLKEGVFSWEILIDMLCYGLWIAALCLAAFVLVLYGFGSGSIGYRCNDSIGDGCGEIFRARATCFATLTWMSVFLACEVIDLRRSFSQMQPGSNHIFQWAFDVWRNKFLFVAVMVGFVTIFPLIYIPGLNRVVIKHTGID
jgi:P-type Na+/K+ transporter